MKKHIQLNDTLKTIFNGKIITLARTTQGSKPIIEITFETKLTKQIRILTLSYSKQQTMTDDYHLLFKSKYLY